MPAFDIVAHRVLWSLPFLALLIAISKGWGKVRAAINRPRTLGILTVTALLIGGNWLLYVYAVTSGHILAASFGYYLNPLANVLLGRFALKERLSRLQWIAVAIAAAGISVLAAGALGQLWISLTLCVSFALYGLLRKIVPADAITGLGVETALLFPLAIAWLGWQAAAGQPWMGFTDRQAMLLMLAGIVSTTPLLLFTAAAKRLPYSTMGMLQFIAPDPAVPDRGGALRRAVHDRARDRLPGDLGRARALCRGNGARAAAAAGARMMLGGADV